MSKAAEVFCDVQGFRGKNNEFVVKEAAFLTVSGSKTQTFVFRPPYAITDLPVTQQKVASWLKTFGHGIAWEDGHIPYWEVSSIFNTVLENYKTVWVKGEEKENFIKDVLKHRDVQVIDLEAICCPPLKDLRKVKQTIKCFYHSRVTDTCACENVRILYDWYHVSYIKKSNLVPTEEDAQKKIGEIIGKYNIKNEYGHSTLNNLKISELLYLPKEYFIHHVSEQEITRVYDCLPDYLKQNLKEVVFCYKHYNQPGTTHVDGPPQRKLYCQQCMVSK